MPVVHTPMGRLIEEQQKAFLDLHGIDLTYGGIARRSKGALTRTRVQQLAKDDLRAMPSPERLQALATALGASYDRVLRAALQSCGYLSADF